MVFADLQRENPTVTVTVPTKLWILAAEVSDRLLKDFKADPNPELGNGFYEMEKGLQTTIVRLEELPNVPETFGEGDDSGGCDRGSITQMGSIDSVRSKIL